MKQPRTPVQAHPTNPASTPPTNNTGYEQPRSACSKTAPAAKLKTDKELPSAGSVVINVQGATFDLSIPDADVLDRAAYMATKYCNLLTRTPSAPATPVERRATLRQLPVQFSRAEAERIIALTATARFVISEEQPQRDKTHWRNAGTLEAVMEDHHARHRENGPNEERATRYLAGDPWFDSGRQIITEGGQIDTADRKRATGYCKRLCGVTPTPLLPKAVCHPRRASRHSQTTSAKQVRHPPDGTRR